MKHLAIVGAGGIGQRHLQSCAEQNFQRALGCSLTGCISIEEENNFVRKTMEQSCMPGGQRSALRSDVPGILEICWARTFSA